MSIGERIRQRRKLLQITQLEIAEQLKMGRSNFGHIENGRVTPSSSDLQKIADILQTNADYLLGRTDDPSPQGAAAGLKTYPEWATSKDKRDLKKCCKVRTSCISTASNFRMKTAPKCWGSWKRSSGKPKR
ncbi:helix-turn-helix transcriptional regulator [Paenibacillus larvae]|nr:helix-turn-helix transcriptional regulator [Paenibacillus larvae]MDT2247055.1 helix-turn-helix transcriptional regulator [Paenibacillus larvae]MDT2258546.1 helix-turn-helix transcriptional regulator [Paenibacillus larvae]MDT2303124.1 helix-turn-helix transcriptional regulator [Paenibacillus larvae]